MQENIIAAGIQPTGRPLQRSLMAFVFPLVVVALIAGALYWLQWSAQLGLTLGYPKPTIRVTNAPTNLLLHQATQFTATGNGRDLRYSWDFGDQTQTVEQASATHTYTSNGTYTVTVSAQDPLGHTSSTSFSVQVLPPLPVASFTDSVGGFFSPYATFDASASSADPSTSIASYDWDFGDGSTTETTYYSQVDHYYNNTGTYTVTLVVVDATGQQSHPYTMTISI